MDGKVIAVWVHSNLDKVELFLNGQSLGMKEMKKDSHLAWDVTYAPGAIEAHGYKGDKLVLTAKRETTGAAAALVITPDRNEISADGEDVAMFAVAVQDAQNRVVPITDNTVTFNISGAGKLIGVGNGDPTCQESDKGTSRKAFSGRCMAIVQSAKSAGSITVEATSPGLTSARATIAAKPVTLRPQIAVWKREVPQGAGATGLWRPAQEASTQIFILHQDGNDLTGSVEGVGPGWAGGFDAPVSITDGKIDGAYLSFKVGRDSYSGKLSGERITLERVLNFGARQERSETQPAASRPAVGPPPDGSDPSRSPLFRFPTSIQMVLHRAQR
jgi:beta-galactosidase